ncbi:MAG: CD225/dispanin family protein [Paramuribaculum sp.]|nr:CD225/dispanin family protein [Paramuribaculum sp.]
MNYYVATPTGQHEGPFTVEELIRRGITPDTLVYNNELGDWTKASMVPEIVKCMYGNPAQNPVGNNQPPYSQPSTPGYQQYNSQPSSPYATPQVTPKTWLAESILVTLFCCLPFGIVGIIKAASVDSLFKAGDYEGAQRASQAAGKWTKIGFFCGLAVYVIYFIIVLIAGFESLN